MAHRSPSSSPTPPFSRPIDVHQVGADGLALDLRATARECAALAALNGLVGIADLAGAFRLRLEGRTGLHLVGTVTARITQTCVVTLEDFDTDVTEPVDLRFLPEAEVETRAAALAARPPDAEAPAEDLPDAIVNGRIDLGVLIGEFLALGLDPYPKKPGAAFAPPEPDQDDKVSPFAALARLKTEPPN